MYYLEVHPIHRGFLNLFLFSLPQAAVRSYFAEDDLQTSNQPWLFGFIAA